jgi:hypothetical protein
MKTVHVQCVPCIVQVEILVVYVYTFIVTSEMNKAL